MNYVFKKMYREDCVEANCEFVIRAGSEETLNTMFKAEFKCYFMIF